ncbi:MAG TPA: hypothetical protein VHB77_05590 [Planctomycetaceae bacterium]|nr:hypothetical protein [Planctomycetaceae bacterium]
MHRCFQVAFVAAFLLMIVRLEAASFPLGKEKHFSRCWPGALNDVANDPARYDGSANLGRFDFWYEGEAKDIQRVLDLYAKVEHPHIHLTVAVGDPAADLQVLQRGDLTHSLTIALGEALKLEDLKLPAKLRIESRQPVSESLDPEKKAHEQNLWAEIQKFVEKHNAALPKAEDAAPADGGC